MIRRLLTDFLNTHAGWLVGGLTTILDTIIGPPVETFTDYKAQSTVQPGVFEWVIALVALGVFVTAGVIGMYVALDFVPGLDRLAARLETPMTRTRRAGLAAGLYALSVVLIGGTNPVSMAHRVRQDTAVVGAMFAERAPDAGIGISGFTWGLLGDPLWEFALQIVLAISVVSALTWRLTAYSEQVVAGLLTVTTVGAYIYTSIAGIQVFPLDVWIAFPLQLLIALNTVVLVVVAPVNFVGYQLVEFLRGAHVTYEPDRPKKRTHVADGVVLLVLVAVLGSYLGGFLAWVFYKVWVIGGGMKVVYILGGYDRECRPDPDTGLETCTWERGET